MPSRCDRPVRATRCGHCSRPLVRVVTGNIIHWTHNPASTTGHTCPAPDQPPFNSPEYWAWLQDLNLPTNKEK